MLSNEEILEACKTGDISKLTAFFKIKANSPSPELLERMLQIAGNRGKPSVLRFLFDRDPSNAASLITEDLVSYSLHGGREVIEVLWERKPGIVKWDLERVGNILACAAQSKNIEFVSWLLEKGADPNGRHLGGWETIIDRAAGTSTPEIVALLLKQGAKIEGTDVLLSAILKGRVDILRVLCENGADVNAILNRTGKLKFGSLQEAKDVTPYRYATIKGQADCLAVLVEFGARKWAENQTITEGHSLTKP